LYPEQVKRWKAACIASQLSQADQQQPLRDQAKRDQREIKALKKELRRKEKALAETAALLALRKKLNALWEDDADN
jgi:hypothetical protein